MFICNPINLIIKSAETKTDFMHEQKNQDQSYVSLSAFLSLDPNNNKAGSFSSKNFFTAQDIQNNVLFANNFPDLSSNSKDLNDDQQNQQNQKTEKQKKQTKNYSKNYRKRHKDYVQSLKKMNQKYQKKIQQMALKIDEMAKEIKSLRYGRQLSDKTFDSMFLKEKEETLKELVNRPEEKNQQSWDKVKQFADIYGFAGRQKINLLNYYMSQIIDNLITDHNKNFVLCGLQDFEITNPCTKIIYQKEQQLCEMNEVQFKNVKKFLKKSMVETLKNFHKSGQDFYESYINLINQTIAIENKFQSIKEGITKMVAVQQYLNVLKWYEENKFCKQIQLLRKQWYQSFRKT